LLLLGKVQVWSTSSSPSPPPSRLGRVMVVLVLHDAYRDK
jgi:hypothetical protein